MLQIAKNGQSAYRIVMPKEADKKNRFGAEELAKYIQKITGAALPVVTDDVPAGEYEICLGPVAREDLPDVSQRKNDGFVMVSRGNRIFLVGHNSRANLYAAYSFLEDILGCRFLTATVETIPQRTVLEVPEFDRVKESPFEYRETSWHCMTLPGVDPKRGFNGAHPHAADNGAGLEDVFRYLSFGHSMYDYVHPDDYFDEHPEYFSMVNGKRIRNGAQLCLTNPEVIDIARKKLRQNIIDHPECNGFSLSQMDWYNPCTCPECARVDAEEGSHAGSLIRFVNACADYIADEFPDVLIDTFAYQYTRQAPKITKPSPNVSVRICDIECCFSHALKDCQRTLYPFISQTTPGVTFQKDLADWSRITTHLVVWDYTTNFRFYIAPMVNLHVLQSNIQFFLENNVTGLFEQGNGESISGEFGELRAYLISKLMWEPYGDVEQWMTEFLTGYYGRAAAPIRAYIKLLSEHVVKYDLHMSIYENPRNYINDCLIPQMDALWDEAEALADNAEVLDRVRKSRLQVRMVKLQRNYSCELNYDDMCEQLIEDIRSHGITRVQEGKRIEKSFDEMRHGRLPGTWKADFCN